MCARLTALDMHTRFQPHNAPRYVPLTSPRRTSLSQVLGDQALAIDGSHASTWPRSWKRFMVDFMYGRGLVMLYPSMKVYVGGVSGELMFG